MLSGFSCFHRHRTVPMVGVAIITASMSSPPAILYMFCNVSGRLPNPSVRTFAMNIDAIKQPLHHTISKISRQYAGYSDIQVILFQELLVTLVLPLSFLAPLQSGRRSRKVRQNRLYASAACHGYRNRSFRYESFSRPAGQ